MSVLDQVAPYRQIRGHMPVVWAAAQRERNLRFLSLSILFFPGCLDPLGLKVTEGAHVLEVARHTISREGRVVQYRP